MNKIEKTKNFNAYPLDGETHFTQHKYIAPKLRDDPNAPWMTEEQDLASRRRISHPLASERLTTTGGKPNKDPEGELRWSRNMIVSHGVANNPRYDLNTVDVEDINSKLRRDAEEIDISIDALKIVDDAIADLREKQKMTKRRHKKELARKYLIFFKIKNTFKSVPSGLVAAKDL